MSERIPEAWIVVKLGATPLSLMVVNVRVINQSKAIRSSGARLEASMDIIYLRGTRRGTCNLS